MNCMCIINFTRVKWVTGMQMLGQVGLVHRVNVEEDKTKLFFRGHGVGITIAAKALKRVCFNFSRLVFL